jgi:hypothetical protein
MIVLECGLLVGSLIFAASGMTEVVKKMRESIIDTDAEIEEAIEDKRKVIKLLQVLRERIHRRVFGGSQAAQLHT